MDNAKRPAPPESVINRIRNVLALAENGATEGERTAAKNALDRLLAKWGIDLDSLITPDETKKWHEFGYNDNYEYRLLIQLAPSDKKNTVNVGRRKGARKKISFELTNAEFIDLSERYEFYRVALKSALEDAFIAFLSVNSLLVAPSADRVVVDLTPEEIERYKRISKMSKGMIPAQFNLKLTEGDK